MFNFLIILDEVCLMTLINVDNDFLKLHIRKLKNVYYHLKTVFNGEKRLLVEIERNLCFGKKLFLYYRINE